jgi:excisionase family DNA binding protein
MKRTFNASEVADALDISVRTVTRHIEAGKLDAAKPGRAYVISRQDLADYLGGMKRVDDIFGPAKTDTDA